MAPKKKQEQKMSLGDFLTDSGYGGGSWADEVEETYVSGTQPLPPSDRPRPSYGGSMFGGDRGDRGDRGYASRDMGPPRLPDKPPYTVHVGNLSYETTAEAIQDLFQGCDVANVRLIEDRELQRSKGFGYVEFSNLEGLQKALDMDGENFDGRSIRVKVADPPRSGDSGRGDFIRDMGDWTRKGPLEPPAPSRGGRGPSDFGERRAPRENAGPEGKTAVARELAWERRGPLAPLPQEEGGASNSRDGSRPRPAPEGLGERSESYRSSRRGSPATWGEGQADGARPQRREYAERPERPERAPTAAEKDSQWRERMRPDGPATGSTPTSPVVAAAAPAAPSRPRLNLQKRTVAESSEVVSPTGGSDSKASPFGAARPIDTATREKEVEEKRQQAIQEKREAEEKAKEERRLAKEAATKAAEEKQSQPEETTEAAEGTTETKEELKPEETKTEEAQTEEPKTEESTTETPGDETKQQNGSAETQKMPIRTREPRGDAPKPRGFDSGNWRSAPGGDGRGARGPPGGRGGRGGARGGRHERKTSRSQPQQGPASPSEPETPSRDEDGWTTVPKKGRQGRP